MTFCHACKEDVRPVMQLGQGGRTSRCPKCGGGLPHEEPVQDAGKAAPKRPRAQVQSAEVDVDIVALAKQRLVFVEARVTELTKYQDEARRLRAMLAAAEPTTPPTMEDE